MASRHGRASLRTWQTVPPISRCARIVIQVELVEDNCELTPQQIEAISEGVAVFGADDATVVATPNFAGVVAEMTDNPAYSTARGGGVVAARTITGPSGSVIVLNYPEVATRTSSDIKRLLAHESGHVAINARGTEETAGNRDDEDSDWQWILKCLGAQAIVEMRIERGLADLGFPAAESTAPDDVNTNLKIANIEVVNAVCDPASEDPLVFHDAILTTLSHVTKFLAHLAAPLIVGNPGFEPSQLPTLGQANWADY